VSLITAFTRAEVAFRKLLYSTTKPPAVTQETQIPSINAAFDRVLKNHTTSGQATNGVRASLWCHTDTRTHGVIMVGA